MQLLDPGASDDNQPNYVDLMDLGTSRECAEALMNEFKGYRWGVRCQWMQGVLDIFCLDVSGNHGYRLHLLGPHATGVYSASAFKAACIRAGGEILERYKLPREKFKPDHYENAPVDFAGNIVGDKAK